MGTGAEHVVLRPMTPADGAVVSGEAALFSHLLATDPGGCWVAERHSAVIGHVASARRETTWVLVSLAIAPSLHPSLPSGSAGVRRQLLEVAGQHARGCLRAMATTPGETATVQALHEAGFALHPTMTLSGVVDRSRLPSIDRVRPGAAHDVDLLDSLGRRRRDAAHGPDHRYLGARYRLLVIDRAGGSGFVYFDDHGPALLAATHRRIAAALLWAALAETPPGAHVVIDRVTGANQWALAVGLDAGLTLCAGGFLGLRGLAAPAPYLAHPDLL